MSPDVWHVPVAVNGNRWRSARQGAPKPSYCPRVSDPTSGHSDARFPFALTSRQLSLLTLTPGTRLGPYEIISALGAGGMGEVYRATDTNLKRQVAIKVLPTSVAA